MMRGIDSRHEIDPTLLLRDTRTIGQRLSDFFSDPTNVSIVLITFAAVIYLKSHSLCCPLDWVFFSIRILEKPHSHSDYQKPRTQKIIMI